MKLRGAQPQLIHLQNNPLYFNLSSYMYAYVHVCMHVLLFYVYECFGCMCVHELHVYTVQRNLTRQSDPLELQLQIAESHVVVVYAFNSNI